MSVVLVLLAIALAVPLGLTESGAAVLGVLGWLVALAARVPTIASAGRLRDPQRGRTILAASSGVTDELVRLGLVLIGVSGFAPALWAGFGWALAELVFTGATRLAQFRWPMKRDAAELLRSQGGVASTHPAHSGVRGTTAAALHLGATLLVAAGPWWVLATAVAHVAVNLSFVRWARHRLALVELFGAAVSVVLLLGGLIVFDRLF
ncbi:hypothetical protein FKR81_19300 [Lentzea tibetensis]|uniref:YhfC family intramembrane metalloprotease n=1 Tax=Lentzea tibetensis TaxID=2591470 RepID=A0A563ESX4_9PSEU|nr:hypothetical protein [Lentzea tibetensis]TWP50753.1 hypothetical protein FKR81_19300 [Lentzea tibetensis]